MSALLSNVFGAEPTKRNLCHPNPCQNGGTCRIVASNSRECSCPEQYGGKYCERKYLGIFNSLIKFVCM